MGSVVRRGLRGHQGTEEKLDQKDSRQMLQFLEILEAPEILGFQVVLALKESQVPQDHRDRMASTVDPELLAPKDFLETQEEMERKVFLDPLDSQATREIWGCQVVKARKVTKANVAHLVKMEQKETTDRKVAKENQVHLDQDLKDVLDRRGIQDVQDHPVRRDPLETVEILVLQDPMGPVAPEDPLDPLDVEVPLDLLE